MIYICVGVNTISADVGSRLGFIIRKMGEGQNSVQILGYVLSEVQGVTESWTRLSDFTCTFHFHALEKEMATHSSVLAWRIPGTGEPGGLPSMGSHRVGHD